MKDIFKERLNNSKPLFMYMLHSILINVNL